MTDRVPVLVTDAPSNANLAVVRSLGRRGIPVGVCGFRGEFNLSFHSRYAEERLLVPSPASDPSGFMRRLTGVLATGRYPLLFPTTERTIQLVSAHRDELPPSVTVPLPEREALETVLDKERTVTLARSLGVPVPATWFPSGPEELPALAPELPYPVILKPRQTNFLAPDGRLQKSGYVMVERPDQLERAYRRIHAAVPRPLIQEIVSGTGAGVFSICDRGTPLAWFAHRRLREEDPRGSRASAALSVPCDPRLIDWSTRLLKALRWHGVVMAEFRWDERLDRCWLIEINGRFWGSLALALMAGMDFPYYLYQLARGETVEAPPSYPAGVMARDAVGELKHFVRIMLGASRAGGPGPSRSAVLHEAATILHPSRASYNWTSDDPAPGRREWLRLLARVLGRA